MRECYCDSSECGTCTPGASGGKREWVSAAQLLAADNARLCSIALAADELAAALEKAMSGAAHNPEIDDALWAYRAVRNGH